MKNGIKPTRNSPGGEFYPKDKQYHERRLTSDAWTQDFDGLVAGTTFDHAGMHVARIWPDGDPLYQLLGWNQLYGSLVKSPGGIFQYVDDIFIDSWSPRLSKERQAIKRWMIDEIFGLVPRTFSIRVSLDSRPPLAKTTRGYPDGKLRVIQAACFGFNDKLKHLRLVNQERCRRLLTGASGSEPVK